MSMIKSLTRPSPREGSTSLTPSKGSSYICIVMGGMLLVNCIDMNFESCNDESRREELIRMIEHSIQQLSVGELEALYYDMVAKDYIK